MTAYVNRNIMAWLI